MTEPRTAAGKKHVEWLVAAHIPTFDGELYRGNFTASVLAIEAEARAAALAEVRQAAREELNSVRGEPDYDPGGQWERGWLDAYERILAALDALAEEKP